MVLRSMAAAIPARRPDGAGASCLSTRLTQPVLEGDGAPLLTGVAGPQRREAPGTERDSRVLVELLESGRPLHHDVLAHGAVGAHHEVETDRGLDAVVLGPVGVDAAT